MIVRYLLRGAGVVALAIAGCAVPALASDATNAAMRGVGSARERGFAGYSVITVGPYGDPRLSVLATTTFTVPKLRCGSADQAIAPSVGAWIDHYPHPFLRLWAATLFVGCQGGKAHYWPELTVNGSIKNYPTEAAHAGDTIVLRLAYGGTGGHVSVADKTHKFKVSRTGRGFGEGVSSAWIGDEGWTNSHHHLARVPDFGTLTYTNSKLYKRPLGRYASGARRANNRSSAGRLQIATGPLFSSGKAFRTYFKHS